MLDVEVSCLCPNSQSPLHQYMLSKTMNTIHVCSEHTPSDLNKLAHVPELQQEGSWEYA